MDRTRAVATGFDDPPADVVREADEHYLRTFADAVKRADALGYDVRGAHSYLLARHYLREGRFRTGLGYLRCARRPEPRQYPGLARTLLAGMGRKLGR